MKNDNPTMVFLPGWGFKSSIWFSFIKKMNIKNYILLDLPPFNDNLDEMVFAIKNRVPPQSIIIGWSLGGLLAIYLAYQFPSLCSKLILVASTPKFCAEINWYGISCKIADQFNDKIKKDYKNLMDEFVKLIQYPYGLYDSPFSLSEPLSTLRDHLVSRDKLPELINYLEFLFHADLRFYYQQIRVPVIHFLGKKDVILSAKINKSLFNLNNHSKIILLQNAGHVPFLSHTDDFIFHFNKIGLEN